MQGNERMKDDMWETAIRLETVEDAKRFVGVCKKVPFAVRLGTGAYELDAKSIMGIFSFDLSQPIPVHADCTADDPFIGNIQEFIAEDPQAKP